MPPVVCFVNGISIHTQRRCVQIIVYIIISLNKYRQTSIISISMVIRMHNPITLGGRIWMDVWIIRIYICTIFYRLFPFHSYHRDVKRFAMHVRSTWILNKTKWCTSRIIDIKYTQVTSSTLILVLDLSFSFTYSPFTSHSPQTLPPK